jgi:type IV pilus assembly protein PilC
MTKKFRYRVKNDQGKTLVGIIEASDKDQAIKMLRSQSVVVIAVNEEGESELNELLLRFQRVKTDDVVNFTRQLATMVAAGLPLTEALSILRYQSSAAMSRVVATILKEVEGGSSLADAMMKTKNVFSDIYIALIKAGEAAGVMEEVLNRLADTLEKQRDFRNKTKGALVYPAIVITGMVAVAIIMMIFVVPKMTQMYKDFGADLPLPTQILMGASDFMVKFWYLVFLAAGIGAFAYQKWSKTETGALIIEETIFKLPIIGPMRKQIILTEFTRTMSLLVSAGISILEALHIVSGAVDSRIIKARIETAADRVEKGQALSGIIAQMVEFPPILGQMLAVGEQTGKVDEIFGKLAKYFEEQSEVAVKGLTTAIEPLIMVVMGIGVGFLVMAVIMPIYNLTSKF